jgi:cell division protein FtsB
MANKKNWRGMAVLLLALTLSITLASCGGPKSLARQYIKLERDIEKAIGGDNPAKIDSLIAKQEKLEEKVEKLSEINQLVFFAEVERLGD